MNDTMHRLSSLSTRLILTIVMMGILVSCNSNEDNPLEGGIRGGVIQRPESVDPSNLSALPIKDNWGNKYELSPSNDFQQAWFFFLPSHGRYKFSMTINSADINVSANLIRNDYVVELLANGERVSSNRVADNEWEFYPLQGGEYTIIVYYNTNDRTQRSEFSLSEYSIEAITCYLYVNQNSSSDKAFTVFSNATTNSQSVKPQPASLYPITTGVMVNAISSRSNSEGTWYKIYYPRGGVINAESETIAWLHGDHVNVNETLSPDCKYLSSPQN